MPSGVAVQVRLPVPYFKIEPQRKLGLCCIWSMESIAFAVAAGMPVQSVRLNRYHIEKVRFYSDLSSLWDYVNLKSSVSAWMQAQSSHLQVPYLKIEPQRKLGFCCIWSMENVASR
ncbi:hypothetical protein VCR9J2_1580004 [Vibrio crassostreae]|nr:hypothetical protein VCR9J2_1580004 [Vibrio crassostreae]